jgi:hypothetical protein
MQRNPDSLIKPLAALAIAAALFATSVYAADDSAATPEREVFVEQGHRSAGDAKSGSKQAGKLATEGTRKAVPQAKGGTATLQDVNQDFWIYDARAGIVFDYDGDGFFTRLELDIDADTYFQSADVFAVIYLSLEGGPWNELTETDLFSIFGQSADDEYYVDTDLISGFPPGYYDVLIELYDDFDGRLVAVYGPSDDIDLFELPLESQTNDDPPGTEVIIVETNEGGGAGGPLMLGALAFALALRRIAPRLRRRG